jgi:hypothetical protein
MGNYQPRPLDRDDAAQHRSTKRFAIASNNRARCVGWSGGRRIRRRRYCHDPSRYCVTRIAVSKSGWTTSPAGRTAGRPNSSIRRSTSYSLTAIRGGRSFNAHRRSSASTNLTRCRLGPTAMSRSATSGIIQSESGLSHGSDKRSGVGARSRISGIGTSIRRQLGD